MLGVDGEAKNLFVEEGKCALHFEPENANSLVDKIKQLYQSAELCETLGKNGHQYVAAHFDRRKLAVQFWTRITHL